MNSKRLGTFKEFLQKQREKRLLENNVSISCDFWDECIVEVMQEIETECQGFMVWETIIKFCKDKWAILGRELPLSEYDDNLLTQHIKDLIFQFHGNSFYTDWKCDIGWDNQQVHSKGLVIEELAAVILEKVKEKAAPQGEPKTGNPTGTLSDREEVVMVPMTPIPASDDYEDEYCEDLPFEKYQNKVVMGMGKYTKMIEEAKQQFRLTKQQRIIDHTLERLEKEAGSLDLEAIAKVVVDKYGIFPEKEGHTMFSKYIKSIVMEYMEKKALVQILVKNDDEIFVGKNTIDGIYDLFAEMVTDEIIDFLTDNNKKEGEDEEVK